MSNVGDVEDMANNAIKILKDDAVYATFKANALKQAERFDIENIVPQYEALYKRVLQ
jgi:glycosyltransferase involved in cell wall biosynthesis